MTRTRTDYDRDICIPLYYRKEAILVDPGLLENVSDASPDTLQPGVCLLFDFLVNHSQQSWDREEDPYDPVTRCDHRTESRGHWNPRSNYKVCSAASVGALARNMELGRGNVVD